MCNTCSMRILSCEQQPYIFPPNLWKPTIFPGTVVFYHGIVFRVRILYLCPLTSLVGWTNLPWKQFFPDWSMINGFYEDGQMISLVLVLCRVSTYVIKTLSPFATILYYVLFHTDKRADPASGQAGEEAWLSVESWKCDERLVTRTGDSETLSCTASWPTDMPEQTSK